MPQQLMTITGNLTADPELRFTPSGQPVSRFSVACSERFRDNATGEWKDGLTTYFTVNAWNDLAEHVVESFIRGNRVIVTGSMQQRSYEAKDGITRTVYEFRADDVGASVRFATVSIRKVTRTRPSGPAGESDPWANASPERPAAAPQEPAEPASAEPAADGPQEPAEPPAGADAGTEPPARTRAPARRRPARTAAQ